MANSIIEELLACPYTPSELIDITRKETYTKDNGAQGSRTIPVGEYRVFVAPPDTMNKNDGAILERLMTGDSTKKVLMVYGNCPDVRAGDTVYRKQKDKLYYEVKIAGHHGESFNEPMIKHDKLYIILKGNQKA